MKFCFVCGKKIEKLIEGYCEDCYNKSFNLIEVPKEIVIYKCSKCERIKQKNAWNAEMNDLILNRIKILGDKVEIRIEGNKIFATGFLKGSKRTKEETHELNIKTIKTICLECIRRLGGYYESVMQLRGNVTEEILNFLDKKIKEKSFYRIETVSDGFNILVGSKDVANHVAEGLKKRYKIKIKKSFKLFTRKEGKDLYRDIFSIECD